MVNHTEPFSEGLFLVRLGIRYFRNFFFYKKLKRLAVALEKISLDLALWGIFRRFFEPLTFQRTLEEHFSCVLYTVIIQQTENLNFLSEVILH